MQVIHGKAKSDPKRVVLAEGDHPKIQRAAKILAEEGLAIPILLSRGKTAVAALKALDVKVPIQVIDPDFVPVALEIPALATLAVVTALLVGLIAYEKPRFAQLRDRMRRQLEGEATPS